jgi:hypothetical protein
VTDGVYVPGVPQGVRPVGRLYVLALPYAGPPPGLSANYRGHWRPKHEATAQLRRDVYFIARQAGLHLLTDVKHVTVELVWNPGTRRRRDADNIYPFLKVAADGLARGRHVAQRVGEAMMVEERGMRWVVRCALCLTCVAGLLLVLLLAIILL